ncbi:MAG: FAD-binding protein [Clostridia bacterium]|nr:FAD-binding protein [Clostridia bacterium]
MPLFDNHQIISLLTHQEEVQGILCYTPLAQHPFALFHCKNVIYATGGPGALYADSVYPESQMGASGIALEAGVKGKNLTEWQFGLASLAPRWNVSGTYMQVLPRFYSVDEEGKEHEFVTDHFNDYGKALSCIFKKGYQWPFDVGKIDGSSLIDLLVYQETVLKSRKVYLDFTKNPLNQPLDVSKLDEESAGYLQSAGATAGTPIERLIHMNLPAYQLYLNKGVDLKNQPLEIAVCAQHNNGGLDIDLWWQSNIKGLFPCGEVAGSHGVFRPGGSALNAGQVGSTRAAQYIAAKRTDSPGCLHSFLEHCQQQIIDKIKLVNDTKGQTSNTDDLFSALQNEMNHVAGILREPNQMEQTLSNVDELFRTFTNQVCTTDHQSIAQMYYYYDLLICAKAYLTAMIDFSNQQISRSSALYPCERGELFTNVPFPCHYQLGNKEYTDVVQETVYNSATKTFSCSYRPVRPIPREDNFFENVWRSYRENKNIR